jgi:hypothetical protein
MLNTIVLLATIAGANPSDLPDPPSDAQVLRALRWGTWGIPSLVEVYRNDITIVKNHLATRTVHLPVFGGVSVALRTESWECVAYYDRVIQSAVPVPFLVRSPSASVVYLGTAELAK